MRRANLARVALRVSRALGEMDCVLVGGMAVGAHGYVRATRDVDFVARVPLGEARNRLRAHGIDAVLATGDPLEGGFPCLRCTVDGVRVDILPPLVPIEWEAALEVPLSRTQTLRVVDLEGLLRLKCRARGPRDLMDAAALILRHPEYGGLVNELGRAYGVAGDLAQWLADPRLRREVEAIEASEVRPATSAAKPSKSPRARGRK